MYRNKEDRIKQEKKYNSSPIGRATRMVRDYNKKDKKYNRPINNNVTRDWVVNNVFSGQKCVYCGESDWTKLGCDRIDNSIPHTAENVVCSCLKCNNKHNRRSFMKFTQNIKNNMVVEMIRKDLIFTSAMEIKNNKISK